MIDEFVFVCDSLVTSAPAHVKSLTTNTEDGVVVENCLTDGVKELSTIKLPCLLFTLLQRKTDLLSITFFTVCHR